MKKKLLITDSFFVNDEHVQRLESAGFEVIRLDKLNATEVELIGALKDVSVYILGGNEIVSERVINSAPNLEAIIFTGVDYDKLIPAAEYAKQKGIKIFNAPGANAIGVGEFAIGVALAMLRELFDISRIGNKKGLTTGTIEGSIVGLIGAGNIGKVIADSVSALNPKDIIYYNRSSKDIAGRQVGLDELLESSDIIFLSLPKSAGLVLGRSQINSIKTGCLIVSISPMNLIDFDALLPRLQKGELRCAIDWTAPSPEFNELPKSVWFHVNSHSGYNTRPALDAVSDSVTKTAISLL